MNIKELFFFARGFWDHPARVGSIIPSSRFLANQMTKPIAWDRVSTVAELGSGTGAITQTIREKAKDSTKVILFEMDKTMREYLRKQYPKYPCYFNARHLVEKINHEGIDKLDAIVSGLPFFNFTAEVREALLEQVVQALKPNGLFITYQYSLHMKKILAEKLIIEDIKYVPLNIPPAFVYICRKK